MLRRLTSLQVLNTMQFYERVVFAIAHVLFQPVFFPDRRNKILEHTQKKSPIRKIEPAPQKEILPRGSTFIITT